MTPRPATIARRLIEWFGTSARDLPWRTPGPHTRRDPYAVLVSEFMLQQTQVSRVIEKYGAFMQRFPSARALADASEHEVLAAWTGLGYYRRARFLHAAARAIRDVHRGELPRNVGDLRALPGIGPYTAGAIASIAFDQPEPLVDGNVQRVLLRLHGRELPLASREAESFAWAHARALVESSHAPGDLNEAIMELGATVCTPRAPACDDCPIRRSCAARREGRTDRIPLPKKPAARSSIDCVTIVLRDRAGRVLMRRRPERGLWAGLWQLPTVESPRGDAPSDDLAGQLISSLRIDGHEPELAPLMSFDFATTHRDLWFRVLQFARAMPPAAARALAPHVLGADPPDPASRSLWACPREALALPISSPMSRILSVLDAPPPIVAGPPRPRRPRVAHADPPASAR